MVFDGKIVMSINSVLTRFAQQNLVLSYKDDERNKIKTSIYHLKDILWQKLSSQIVEIIDFGSYTRNTILPRKHDPNSDIDLMIVFNNDNLLKPETYRRKLLSVVTTAYPNSISKKDFPAVKLELNHIKFDLVPAYTQIPFLGGKRYYIPAKDGEWMQTTPNDINQLLSDRNQECGNNIIRNAIRLCKHWNAFANYPFESYLMEKEILSLRYFNANDTYSRFVYSLNDIAGDIPSVRQAIDYIYKYNNQGNEEKQFFWLKKLLPGLCEII